MDYHQKQKLEKEIELKAREKLSFTGTHDSQAYSLSMKMIMQINCHLEQGTRPPRDLCILLQRFII